METKRLEIKNGFSFKFPPPQKKVPSNTFHKAITFVVAFVNTNLPLKKF